MNKTAYQQPTLEVADIAMKQHLLTGSGPEFSGGSPGGAVPEAPGFDLPGVPDFTNADEMQHLLLQ